MKWKQGDKRALEKIVDSFFPFIIKRARCTYVKGYDMDDLIQIGRISVIKAAFKYDINQNPEFTSYVMNAIKINFYCLIRDNIKLASCCSLNSKNNDGLEFGDILEAEENTEHMILDKEKNRTLYEALNKLKKDYREIIEWFYFKNRTLEQYCKEKGIAYRTAVKRKGQALKELKRIMSKN